MKKLTVLLFPALVLGMLTAGVAYAQTAKILKGDIPFEFTVVGKTLPAGSYSVLSSPTIPILLCIRGTENLESAYFVTYANDNSKNVTPKFVFRRYGNQYFLAEIWTGEGTSGHDLSKSSKELQVAKSYGEPQLIYIAAK
jgi:hypothetical protein